MKSEVIVNQPPSGAPKVFISSTVADLKEYRDKASARSRGQGPKNCWCLLPTKPRRGPMRKKKSFV
jgi:hypothetical protein